MSDGLVPGSGFRIRAILGQALDILGHNLIPIAIVSVLMTGLYELGLRAMAALLGAATERVTGFGLDRMFETIVPPRGSTPDPATALAALVAVPALFYVCVQMATIAISMLTFRHLAGRPGHPLAALAFGAKALLPALGIICLMMLSSAAAVGGVLLAFLLVMVAAQAFGASSEAWMLLMPAITLLSAAVWIARLLRDWVAVPAFVLEGLGMGASLRRSAGLTRGRRGRILRLYMLVLILGGLVAKIAGGLLGTALMTAFAAVLVSVVYIRLRVEKEGLTAADIARQLDLRDAVDPPPVETTHKRATGRSGPVVMRRSREHPVRSAAQLRRRVIVGAGALGLLLFGAVVVGAINAARHAGEPIASVHELGVSDAPSSKDLMELR